MVCRIINGGNSAKSTEFSAIPPQTRSTRSDIHVYWIAGNNEH